MVTITGTNLSEAIKGSIFADLYFGRGGNDTLNGDLGNDTI